MNIKALFGTNLKLYRKKRHLSQEQLAEQVDISAKHLSKIERVVTFISADLLEKLSDCLEISIAQLFCKKNEYVYDNLVTKFEGITEKHLNKAMEGIKKDMRQDDAD